MTITTEYDDDEDILSLYDFEPEDYDGSVSDGDFRLDLNSKGKIVGIEILNASKNLRLTKEKLKEMV